MRLDKYLAHAGLGTRKEVKLAIRKGRVSVNGEVCRKDDRKIQEGVDVVCLDKEEIYYEAVVYIMLNSRRMLSVPPVIPLMKPCWTASMPFCQRIVFRSDDWTWIRRACC